MNFPLVTFSRYYWACGLENTKFFIADAPYLAQLFGMLVSRCDPHTKGRLSRIKKLDPGKLTNLRTMFLSDRTAGGKGWKRIQRSNYHHFLFGMYWRPSESMPLVHGKRQDHCIPQASNRAAEEYGAKRQNTWEHLENSATWDRQEIDLPPNNYRAALPNPTHYQSIRIPSVSCFIPQSQDTWTAQVVWWLHLLFSMFAILVKWFLPTTAGLGAV